MEDGRGKREAKKEERREMEVETPVIATPGSIRGKQSPLWQLSDKWGLLRRHALGVTPRNDSPDEF
jgi:hypothetical protein